MKEILLLILGGVLVNNYAFEKFLGVTPLLGYSRKENKLVALGLSVTVVMLLVAAIAYPVQAALANSGLGYLATCGCWCLWVWCCWWSTWWSWWSRRCCISAWACTSR